MNIIEIENLNTSGLEVFSKLSENQLFHINEPDQGVFIAESPYVIDLALKAGYTPLSFVAKRNMLSHEILKSFPALPIYTADDSILSQITGFELTYGILCQMKRKTLDTVEKVCKNAKRIAVLEHIMNPTNVGAIMRSAAALSIDALLLSYDCADPLYRRASRVSMGTVFQMLWTYFPKNEPYKNIEYLKDMGFKTVAMALTDNSISVADKNLKRCEKLAIVLGSEGEGLTRQTIDVCDFTAKIPMQKGVDSLNVAAASSVIFWELTKKFSEHKKL